MEMAIKEMFCFRISAAQSHFSTAMFGLILCSTGQCSIDSFKKLGPYYHRSDNAGG